MPTIDLRKKSMSETSLDLLFAFQYTCYEKSKHGLTNKDTSKNMKIKVFYIAPFVLIVLLCRAL